MDQLITNLRERTQVYTAWSSWAHWVQRTQIHSC